MDSHFHGNDIGEGSMRLPRHFTPRNDRKMFPPHPNPLPPGERGKRMYFLQQESYSSFLSYFSAFIAIGFLFSFLNTQIFNNVAYYLV